MTLGCHGNHVIVISKSRGTFLAIKFSGGGSQVGVRVRVRVRVRVIVRERGPLDLVDKDMIIFSCVCK